ncbi:MAG: hypothetical protein ACI4L5_01300 [Negativibacillus sp.]
MSLTRKMLKAMGIEEEKIDQIIEAHSETVDSLKAYKADAEKLASVQKELDDLKAAGDGGYKEKYQSEHAAFEQYKAEISAEKTKAAKAQAYRSLLKEVGISDKRLDAVLRVSDLEKLELVDGKLKDADALKEKAKSDWADFIVTTETKGADTATPPDNNPGPSEPKSLAEALKERYKTM